MLKRFFFPVFFLPLICFAQFADSTNENYKVYYYEDNVVSSEGLIINGKPNGYWITYYPNQLRKSEGNRVNFMLDGLWKFYDKKGNIENSIEYKEDKKNGEYKSYNDECLLIKLENYKADVIDGNTVFYYPDSSETKIKKIVPFENGRKEGLGFEYGIDGRITAITTYKKNFIVSNEKVNQKDSDGLKQGPWKSYFPNGRLKQEERYKNDLLNGYLKIYNQQGKLESADLYLNGEKQSDENNIADFDINSIYYDNGVIKNTSIYNKAGEKRWYFHHL